MSGDDFTPPRSSSFETSRGTASADMCHTHTCAMHTISAPPPHTHSFCSGVGARAKNLPSHKWGYSLSQLLISTLFNSHRCVIPSSPLKQCFLFAEVTKKRHQPHLKSNWWHFRVQRSRWWGCLSKSFLIRAKCQAPWQTGRMADV